MGAMEAFALLLAASFLGAAVQAATGFGFALLAAPIYLTAMGSSTAMQVLVAVHLVQSAMLVPGLWRQAPRRLLVLLCAGGIFGFPVGLAVFLSLDLKTLTLVVGITMLAFSALLAARELRWLRFGPPDGSEARASGPAIIGAGGIAGLLTAVLVTPGPPVIILNGWLRLSKDQSRALSLTFFAFCYVAVAAMHTIWGGMTLASWKLAAMLSPLVIVGTLAGDAFAKRLSEAKFRLFVLAIAGLSGCYALLSGLLG
ncbi:MAG TPA: sulfite exporter TauE/SafE family protein [Hyphomicrobiaceae bacterium]|nr:sulfite exporter TauE/SafE family protein [Hyphomicrobiaceae bacterium]